MGDEAAVGEVGEKAPDSLEALKLRVLAASAGGVLEANICAIVEQNRQQAAMQGTAA